MDPKVYNHLEILFLESSRAASRKRLYALRAEKDGKPQLAKLFSAIAMSEETQARRFLLQLRGQINSSEQNIITAFDIEIPDIIEKYNIAASDSETFSEKAMYTAFSQSSRVQRMHLNLKKKLSADPAKNCSYHVCNFCGFIMEKKPPANCPVCTAPAHRFIEI